MRRLLERYGPVVAVVAVLVGVTAVTGAVGDDGPPLDPQSTGPDGTAALAAVLDRLGADVVVATRPGDLADADAVLLLRDPSGPGPTQERWADAVDDVLEGGGVVVVADPESPRSPPLAGLLDVPLDVPACDLDPVSDLGPVRTGGRALAVPARSSDGPDDGRADGEPPLDPDRVVACYPAGDDAAWLLAAPRDGGTVVAIADARVWTNANLDVGRHAELAVALLAPRTRGGATRVAIVGPRVAAAAAAGTRTLTDLLPDRVRLALLQALVAAVVVVAWRARRLGGPVHEPLPVVLPAADLVVATGRLLAAARAPQAAAAQLSDALRRDLGRVAGVPDGASAGAVTSAAAALGVAPDDVAAALDASGVTDDAALVAHARRVAEVRAHLTPGRPGVAEPTAPGTAALEPPAASTSGARHGAP